MDAGDTDDAECVICHLYCHKSAVECECCPRRRTCLRHAHALCECPPPKWRLAFRHSLADLRALLCEVAARIPEGPPAYIHFRVQGSGLRVRARHLPGSAHGTLQDTSLKAHCQEAGEGRAATAWRACC